MNKRAINGILLLDKPLGMSSNGALQRAKRVLQAKKAGHTGSLDPLATGLLPLCFGEATKFSQYLLDADKQYVVTATLGSATDTGDKEGQVIARCDHSATQTAQLLETISSFIGESSQIPPMYSALKHQGKPLYELARKGITIDRPARTITIHAIQDVQATQDTITFSVHCSKGTYIRTLVEDIAKSVGTLAHIIMLRRMGVGALPKQMLTLEDLEQDPATALQALIPVDHAIAHFPICRVSGKESQYLQQGVAVQQISSAVPGFVRLYNERDQFFGLGEINFNAMLKPVRLVTSGSLVND